MPDEKGYPTREEFLANYGVTVESTPTAQPSGFPTRQEFLAQFGQQDPLTPDNPSDFPTRQEFLAQYGYSIPGMPGAAPPPEDSWEITKGLKRGMHSVMALGHGFLAATGDLATEIGGVANADSLGITEFTQNRINDYKRWMEDAEKYAPEVATIEEIDSVPKFFKWAASMTGEQIPIIASTFATGGIGGLVGRVAARQGIKNATSRIMADQIASQLTARGAATGAYLGASALEAGGIAGERIENDLPLSGGTALLGGGAAGLFETVLPLKAMQYFGLGGKQASGLVGSIRNHLAGKGIAERMLTLGGLGAVTEGTTEAIQEAIAIGARKYVDENYDTLGEESASRILNAAAGGALLGVLFGGVSGIPKSRGTGNLGGETNLTEEDFAGATPSQDSGPIGPPPPVPVGPPPASAAYGPQLGETIDGMPVDTTTGEIIQTQQPEAAGLPGDSVEIINEAPVTPVQRVSGESLAPQSIILKKDMERPVVQPSNIDQLRDDPQAYNLIVARNRLLANQESYTEKGGFLTKHAQQTLETLESDLALRAQELGIEPPNFPPLPTRTAFYEGEVAKLKPGERKQLAKLEELEQSPEGLNDRQYERLEKLRAKAQGVAEPQRISGEEATQAAVAEMEAEDNQRRLATKIAARDTNLRADTVEGLRGPLYGGSQQQQGGITREDFESARQAIGLENEGTVQIIAGPQEISNPRVRADVEAADARNPQFKTQGVYDPQTDTTYFMLDRIGSKKRATSMYLHEVMVHHGLRTLPTAIRKQIIALIRRDHKEQMRRIAAARNIAFDINNEDQQRVLAEEVLAELAEKNDFDLSLWKRIVARLRAWIRSKTGLTMTEDDLRYILLGLKRHLSRKGPGQANNLNPDNYVATNPNIYFGVYPSDPREWSTFFPIVTLRIINNLPKKDTLTRMDVWNALDLRKNKNPVYNDQEKQIVENVLLNQFEGREEFMRSDLENAIRDALTPMYIENLDAFKGAKHIGASPIMIKTLKNLGLNSIFGQFAADTALPEIHILRFGDSIFVPKDMNHFKHSHYAAHMRGFSSLHDGGTHYWSTEIQSDMVQKMNRTMSVEEKEGVLYERGRWTGLKNTLQTLRTRLKNLVEDEAMGNRHGAEIIRTLDEANNVLQRQLTDTDFLPIVWLHHEAQDALAGITPSMMEDILLEAESGLRVRIAELNTQLAAENYAGDHRAMWQQISPKMFQYALDADIRYMAARGYESYSLIDADTMAFAEGWLGGYAEEVRFNQEEAAIFLPPDRIPDMSAEGSYIRFTTMESMLGPDIFDQDFDDSSTKNAHVYMFEAIQQKWPGGIKGYLKDKNPTMLGIYRRHEQLYKRFIKDHNAKEIEGPSGWGKFARIPLTPAMGDSKLTALFGGEAITDKTAIRAKNMGATDDVVEAIQAMGSAWKMKIYTKLLTMVQMADKFKIPVLQQYVNRISKWAADKMEIISEAESAIEDWRGLGKEQANALTRALFAITQKSDEEQRKLSHEEKYKIFQQYKMDEKAIEVYGKVEQTLANVRKRMRTALFYNRARSFLGDEVKARDFVARWEQATPEAKRAMGLELEQTYKPEQVDALLHGLNQTEEEFRRLENRDYFPYKRFGKYTVKMRATKDGQRFAGKEWKENDVVGFYTFENATEQKVFFNSPQIREWSRSGTLEVSMGIMREKEQSIADMPYGFIDELLTSGQLALTEDQKQEIRQLTYKYAPGRAFVQHMIHRKGIQGMSLDAMRVFGTYMQSASNHIARSQHYIDLQADLKGLQGVRNQMELYAGDTSSLDVLENSLNKHLEYIMNPGQEWAAARAIGFTWYLGFNVKSAAINFTQIPMVTYPYLAERYGAGRAFNMLMSSMKEATLAFNPKTMGKKLPPYLNELMERAIKEGFIDEAMAVELAGVAQGPLLSRVIPSNAVNRGISQFAYYAATPFRFTEKLTRRTAFIAAVKLARSNGASMEEAYVAGRDAVRATLFEYAKWNRPEFMRGKKSVFFLFWTFMQHMAFTLFGGQGAKTAMGVWLMLLMMGGLQGLPFIENLLDMIDWGSTKVKTALGMKNPKTDLRLKIRELIASVSDNPDLWMHGLSRYYGLGPLHLLEAIGAPIPNLDVSGSVSMGRMLPGTEELFGTARSVDEKLGRTLADIGGPVFGIPYALFKAMADDNPDQWKRWERAMPSAMKAANRATRLMTRGQEEFKGGGAVVKFDPYNTEQMIELIGQAFAFTPTRLNQRYEAYGAQEELKRFILTQRQKLMTEYDYVYRTRDREGIKDVREAINQFNRYAPDPRLRITPKVLRSSIEERERRRQARERGVPIERGLRRPLRDVMEAFPEVTPGQ